MADTTVAANFRLARLVAGEGLNAVWRGFGKPWRYARGLRTRAPERLLISPQDIRTADPTVANDIYGGYFSFAGKMINTHGRSPFEIAPPSAAWSAGLTSFSWLRHLRSADTALARANARALVEDWIEQSRGRPNPSAWEPKVAARRLLSWLSQSPMILEGADHGFYRRFMKALGQHAARLERAFDDGLKGEARLFVAVALVELGLCSAGMERLQKRATRLLSDELKRQILSDGGHVGRNPQSLVDFLLDLLPLRQAFAASGVAPPQELLNAIDRMLPMLRLFRLSDGSLALFNGMGATQPHAIATVLAYDDTRAPALPNAPYSGYQRLEAGGSLLIVDTGSMPPSEFSTGAHAGQLSFEFCPSGQKLVSNCGAPDEIHAELRAAARATAAHSTLTVADTSSSRFAASKGLSGRLKGRVLSGVRKVTLSRQAGADVLSVAASHDGYVADFGLIHERTLRLSTDGSSLEGADLLRRSGAPSKTARNCDFALRFHLHPSVRAQMSDDGRSVWLWLPNGAAWRFHANGLPIEIEASVYFAAPEGARPCGQVVVRANTGQVSGVSWIFERAQANA